MKADGVRRDVLDGESVAHHQKVLKMVIGILMWLLTEWMGLHHVGQCRLHLKGRIAQVQVRARSDKVS